MVLDLGSLWFALATGGGGGGGRWGGGGGGGHATEAWRLLVGPTPTHPAQRSK